MKHDLGHNFKLESPKKGDWKSWLYIGIVILVAVLAALLIWWLSQRTASQLTVTDEKLVFQPNQKSTENPKITDDVVVSGLAHVWEINFLPDATMIFTERQGRLSAFIDGQVKQIAQIDDVKVIGEGGLLGLAVDPNFNENRQVYTCFNSIEGDVRVVRFKLSADLSELDDRNDIVTEIPANNSGRHSGCRIAFGPDNFLWIDTGDAALNDSIPQDPQSLGGKILRVDGDGNAAPGNFGGNFDPRIYSFGHRNTQGIAFFAKPIKGVVGVSVEHGSYQDDEVNPLLPGNFGWSPGANYNELGVPMTDKARFTDAIEPIWKSGESTIAPSGAAILKGKNWKAWEGAIVTSVLKDARLRIFEINDDLQVTNQKDLFVNTYGRLRAATMGPGNALYISSSNGKDDKIIRISTTD